MSEAGHCGDKELLLQILPQIIFEERSLGFKRSEVLSAITLDRFLSDIPYYNKYLGGVFFCRDALFAIAISRQKEDSYELISFIRKGVYKTYNLNKQGVIKFLIDRSLSYRKADREVRHGG